jgi:predicted DNA-binding protein YlxM (UPF0122 family)
MALDTKQKKILQLLKRNIYSIDEIATKVGCSDEYIQECILGESTVANVKDFQEGLKKVDDHIAARTQRRAISTKELLLKRLESWVKHNLKKAPETSSQHRQLVDSINVLKREVPEYASFTWIYKEGMSMSEALDEYKRLTALAKGSTERRRVSELGTGGSAKVSRIDKYADPKGEDSQGSLLPTLPEAGVVPQK